MRNRAPPVLFLIPRVKPEQLPPSEDVKKLERHGYRIPLSPRKGTFVKNRVLLTGDSAGFTDPVTAEGITYAIYSGRLAAQAIISSGLNEMKTIKIYNSLIRKSILPDIKAGKIIAYLIYRHPGIRHFFLRNYGQKLSEIITDVIMGERTYRGLIKSPANYSKLFKFWLAKRIEKYKLKNDRPLSEN